MVSALLLLGFEPRLPRIKLVKAFGEDGQIGLGLRVVEAHHHVSGIDELVVAHAKLADHAARSGAGPS